MNNQSTRNSVAEKTPKNASLKAAMAFFEEERLPFPPMPEAFIAEFDVIAENMFGTRDPEYGLYSLGYFLYELQTKAVEDYLLMGFDGHGVSSWAAHYYLVQGPLAVFLQLGWGDAFEDNDQARQKIEEAVSWLGDLIAEMDKAVTAGRVSKDMRLLIIAGDFSPPRWAWVPAKPFDDDETEWHLDPPVMANVLKSLRNLPMHS